MQNSAMRVLLISPQHWGIMRVSKHHYAIELAKMGHKIFFLEPTEASWKWNRSNFEIVKSDTEGVILVRQSINVPYNLKFHAKGIFDWYIKQHIQKLEKHLGPFDLVWSFDLTNAMPLKFFSQKAKKIFFAADWPQVMDALKAADGADLLVSVAHEILDQFPANPSTKKILIDHGVADCFIEAGKQPFVKSDDVIRVGMSGNFLRPDIDRPVLLEIIRTHSDLVFECFGAYEFKNSNLGGSADAYTIAFIEALQNAPNVILHGMVRPEVLAKELRRMDAFLICYDVEKDQSKGTNYHKVMEYLAYGRPIVANYVSKYSGNQLVKMPLGKYRNDQLISIFSDTIYSYRESKFQFSSVINSYSNQLDLIINEV